ncbi:MAG: SseB family protein [Planctomycetota bacterium]|jgi:hypothetical protein
MNSPDPSPDQQGPEQIELPPSNPAEHKLAAASAGECSVKDLVHFLLDQSLCALLDAPFEPNPDGTCPAFAPLLMSKDGGVDHLALFTSPDRARRVIKMKPEYQYAFSTHFSWWLKVAQPHWGFVINPTWGLTLEISPDNAKSIRSQIDLSK